MSASRPEVELPPTALPFLPAALAELVPTDMTQFFAALELGYLAASADGLDATERATLAGILEGATGAKIDQQAFDAHFADLDASVAMLGRRERLARTAADFENDASRADAIRFAALVAMADGRLGNLELDLLTEAGTHFEWSADRIHALVEEAAGRVRGDR